MPAHHFSLLLPLFAALTLPACVDHDHGSATLDSPRPLAECAAGDSSEESILACGFGPGLALVGADAQRIYAVSDPGTYFAIDRTTGVTTRLFHDLSTGSAVGRQSGAVVHEGRVIFPTNIDDGESSGAGLLAIDGSTDIDAQQPDVLMIGTNIEPMAAMVDDGDRLYASSVEHDNDFSTFSGRVISIGYDGSHLAAISPDYGSPFGVADGHVYYLHDREAKRVSITGGPAQTVTTGLADSASSNHAVDAQFVYGSTSNESPWDLTAFPVAGGTSHVLATFADNPEVPLGPVHDLRLDDGWLYFLRGAESYNSLYRIRHDGAGGAERLAAGVSLFVPVFDADSIYVAYTRGGFDAPIESVIARIAK